eukprot:1805502-Pleurochrysis_carterae.AAC.1
MWEVKGEGGLRQHWSRRLLRWTRDAIVPSMPAAGAVLSQSELVSMSAAAPGETDMDTNIVTVVGVVHHHEL